MPGDPDYQATLLPPTATDHDQRLDRAAALTDALWAAAERVGDLKTELPPEAIPFLIWELALEEVAPWIADPLRLIREGRAWQKIRGTPASIAQALSWADIPLAAIEEHPAAPFWDVIQLELSAPLSIEATAPAVALTRLAKPAHIALGRIYSGWDERVLDVNGAGRINGGARVNDWSGVRPEPGWPKLSFGRTLAARSEAPAPSVRGGGSLSSATITRRSSAAFIVNTHRVNGQRRISPRRSFGVESRVSATLSPFERPKTGWPSGGWPEGGWLDHGETDPRWTARGSTTLA